MNKAIEQIEAGKIVAILRGDYGAMIEEIAAALSEAGITAVEVTMNSPDALASINRLATKFASRMAVGAGTVLRPAEVEQAAKAGAQFIVSPNRNVSVIETTKREGLVSLPGCFTPSEIVEALDAGADAIKIFPANTLGPAYVKAVMAPLGKIRIVPTGGVTPESATDYLNAGAWALGVGSELVSADVKTPGGLERLRERATAFVKAVSHD
ncbi:MAG: bifunctional 4-hydroxy-2-oxoglutarate aldolase/2-dehydro-3-deoxy-phosphogluconate aldolase [Blastocatellales bacterium]